MYDIGSNLNKVECKFWCQYSQIVTYWVVI